MRLLILAGCLLFGPAQAAHEFAADLESTAPRYQSEWWQLSASLADRDGRLWGLEWSLYRQNSPLQGADGSPHTDGMSLAHVAITTPDGEYYQQRFEHGEILQTGNGSRAKVVLADEHAPGWEWVSQGAALFPARLSFSIGDRDLNLLLDSPVKTVSSAERSALAASGHFTSDPLIRVRGFVDQGASKTYLRGQGRLDREWQLPALAGNLVRGD